MFHELKYKGVRGSQRRNCIFHVFHRKYVESKDSDLKLVKADAILKRKFYSY